MYGFWYDYVKSKYGEKAELYYVNINSFIVYVWTDKIYKDNAQHIKKGFHTLNYKLERPPSK